MTRREPRWWFVLYSFGLGVVIAVAALAGGQRGLALFAVPWLTAGGIAMSFTPWGSVTARARDEREQGISTEAVAIMGFVLIVVIILGGLVQLVRGHDAQPWTFLGFVGGATFLLSLAVLSRRR